MLISCACSQVALTGVPGADRRLAEGCQPVVLDQPLQGGHARRLKERVVAREHLADYVDGIVDLVEGQRRLGGRRAGVLGLRPGILGVGDVLIDVILHSLRAGPQTLEVHRGDSGVQVDADFAAELVVPLATGVSALVVVALVDVPQVDPPLRRQRLCVLDDLR